MYSCSFIATGNEKPCSQSCKYCSSGSKDRWEKTYSKEGKHEFKLDKEAIYNLLSKDPRFVAEMKNKHPVFQIDLWKNCGDSLDNLEELKTCVHFLEHDLVKGKTNKLLNKAGNYTGWRGDVYDVALHTSDNGLNFANNDKFKYLVEHNIGVQLSHDGYGQWVRTGENDPCNKSSPSFRNLVNGFRCGMINWVNTTLSYYNYSFFKNIDYWNKFLIDNNLNPQGLFIKLNHSYDGPYNIEDLNTFGHWQDGYKKELIGTKIGMWGLHNGPNDTILDDYIHEFKLLYLMMIANPNKKEFLPFKGYILEQGKRWDFHPSDDDLLPNKWGACYSYQYGISATTFAWDSEGYYTECNLIDHYHHVDNKTGKRPDYCKECKYHGQAECHSCGSMNYPEKCGFKWKWLQCLEELSIVNNLLNNKNNNNKNCNCSTEKKQPVYCVKDYQI